MKSDAARSSVESASADSLATEPDASNASYFLAAAAIHPGSRVTIEGLGERSLQGDVGFADVLHRMGADLVFGGDFITIAGTKDFEGTVVDLYGMPDTAQTLAVVSHSYYLGGAGARWRRACSGPRVAENRSPEWSPASAG